MNTLKKYFRLQNEIYDYFGYQEDWVVIPLEDNTADYWYLTGEGHGDQVFFSSKPLSPKLILDGENLYCDIIYTQRFLPKWVYRGAEFTMVCADTRTDGNKLLRIFDNRKELVDPTPEQLAAFERWKGG